ncbi:MAG: M24 family metallopeptidase [Clostridiales bacterium]|jgi:Xaa-Pro aminopeptidase|nr:M24 family metallopeptidase [Clostridiales bacterium]
MLLGGPESEPFAKQSSAVKDTYNFTVFMVPDEEYPNAVITDFAALKAKLGKKSPIKRIGLVGVNEMPHAVYVRLAEGFNDAELIDITGDYLKLRYVKSAWEIEQAKKATRLSFRAYKAMKARVRPGVKEIAVAAAGESVCRRGGANGFAYQTIVGSGARSNAVVPTATDKVMETGETVMLGIAPRINGYAGTFGHTVPVSGDYTAEQRKYLTDMVGVLRDVKAQLKPGAIGKDIDKAGRNLYLKGGYLKYIVCPFAHTMGLMEAEAPFFGSNSDDVLRPNMLVNVDVSFFGHPTLNGVRVETCYVITKDGAEALCPEMENELLKILG